MTHRSANSNNKGGVGKSLLTAQEAAALARRGKRVLCVDMDPQANLTRRLGVEFDPANPILTMSEVIKANADGVGEEAVVPCGWATPAGEATTEAAMIDVLPSRFDLINRELEAGMVGATRRLQRSLDGWSDRYDVVLIDTPPNLGPLVQMAFAAVDTVIIPTDAGYDSIEAAIRVSDFVQRHGVDLGNPVLGVGGVIVNRKRATVEDDYQVRGLIEQFGDLVWSLRGVAKLPNGAEVAIPQYIPEWKRFREADGAAVSLSAWTDQEAKKTVALFDKVAAIYDQRFLQKVEVAA